MKTSQLMTLAIAALGLTTGAVAEGRFKGDKGTTTTTTAAAAAAAAAAATTSAAAGGNNKDAVNTGNNNAGGNNALNLLQSNVQGASDFIGNVNLTSGQSNSNTDPANFINFCSGKTTTNGTQNTAGSCNGVVMGDIPSKDNMVSAVVLFPGPGQDLPPNQSITFKAQLTNLVAGSFTDPLTTYYAAPQALKGGNIVGHSHFTVQDLGGSLAPTTPDPKTFAFFKGIDDAGNGEGLLSATLAAGLPAGFYRICTLNAASNHQPVLMPVAQRGGQDDCQKFTVGQGSGNAGGGAGSGDNESASTTAAAAAATTTTTSAAAAATTTAAAGDNGSKSTGGKHGGKFGGGRGRGRFAARDLIA